MDDSNFPEHPGAILDIPVKSSSWRNLKISPKQICRDPLLWGRTRADPPYVLWGLQWESGSATFYLAEMTVEPLIFYRTTAVICHQNVPGKLRVFHSFQELARPNAKNIHFANFHFCHRLALHYYYFFSHSQCFMPDFWRNWNLATLYMCLYFWVGLARWTC